MRKHYIYNKVCATLCLVFLLSLQTWAQRLTIQGPAQAEVGRRIRVSYVLNSTDFDRIQLDGNFDGFDVLFGPGVSTSQSISIINGKTTQSSSTTFSYTLQPKKAGTFVLPSASLHSGGKLIKSGPGRIQVLPASGNSQQQSSGNYNGGGGYSGQNQSSSSSSSRMHTPSTDEHISSSELYMAVTASKKRVYEQEAILITYKLYSLVTVEQLAGEMPQLDGFHTQEIELPQQRSFKMERIGNKNYGTVVWRQYVVFPQKTGKLTIPSIDYEADVVVQDRNVDPFEAFFGGGSVMQRVKKIVKAPAVQIQVDALPSGKPANFSGAVGHGFSIKGKLIPQQIDANDATTMMLTVSGTGNMKLMSAPTIQWPKDFESYDPKTTEKTKITTSGLSGTVSYECVAVPHHGGKYTIPGAEFCYFDTESHTYKTIKTDDFTLAVAKGNGGAGGAGRQEDVKDLGNDIRYIKTGTVTMQQKGTDDFGSLAQLLAYALLLVPFIALLIIFRRQAKANANVALQRGRKASKAATKRLKNAAKLLKTEQAAAFYDEVMRALWGYVADKLNLPLTDLNKENVSEKLQARDVDEETTRQFLDVLSECEFARFAPGDPASTMDHLYQSASDVINKIDSMIRR